jgi:hypothetical protein
VHGPPWSGGGTNRRPPARGGMLTGVGPPTTPGHESSPARAEGEERSTRIPL